MRNAAKTPFCCEVLLNAAHSMKLARVKLRDLFVLFWRSRIFDSPSILHWATRNDRIDRGGILWVQGRDGREHVLTGDPDLERSEEGGRL